MPNIDKLMFKREHLPVKVRENYFDVEIPPYHPSMAKTGIDVELAVSVLDEALEGTVHDLESIAGKIPHVKDMLDGLAHRENGKIQYGDMTRGEYNGGTPFVEIKTFPFIRTGLEIYSYGVYTKIGPGNTLLMMHGGYHYFFVPKTIIFSQELMNEYEMKDEEIEIRSGFKTFSCPNLWMRVTLFDSVVRVFCKNLVIALDNAVVKRKYQK